MTDIHTLVLKSLAPDLATITTTAIRTFTTECIKASPAAYWLKPSAFYKGHHPADELQEWGNLRHVKRTLVIATILAEINELLPFDRDMLYSALIIHDIGKYGPGGDSERILNEHPELVPGMVVGVSMSVNPRWAYEILGVVITHMGRWGKYPPVSRMEHLGHYADCIASRATLDIRVEIKV